MLNEHLLSTEQILIIAMVSVKGENEEDQSETCENAVTGNTTPENEFRE